jgi:hypothetical protein
MLKIRTKKENSRGIPVDLDSQEKETKEDYHIYNTISFRCFVDHLSEQISTVNINLLIRINVNKWWSSPHEKPQKSNRNNRVEQG